MSWLGFTSKMNKLSSVDSKIVNVNKGPFTKQERPQSIHAHTQTGGKGQCRMNVWMTDGGGGWVQRSGWSLPYTSPNSTVVSRWIKLRQLDKWKTYLLFKTYDKWRHPFDWFLSRHLLKMGGRTVTQQSTLHPSFRSAVPSGATVCNCLFCIALWHTKRVAIMLMLFGWTCIFVYQVNKSQIIIEIFGMYEESGSFGIDRWSCI